MRARGNHPVWDVYDELRTARLNVKYYSCCLARVQKFNMLVEITLAITAPSSSAAALWFWKTQSGELTWQALTVLTAFLAVAKPFMRLAEKISKYEEILAGYRTLDHDLDTLAVDIRQSGTYSNEHKSKLREALERKGALIAKAPQAVSSRSLIKRCQTEVETELPHLNFFIPEERNA